MKNVPALTFIKYQINYLWSRDGVSPSNDTSISHLHSQIRFLRLMENVFNSESVQLGLEAIEQTAEDKKLAVNNLQSCTYDGLPSTLTLAVRLSIVMRVINTFIFVYHESHSKVSRTLIL